MEESRNTIGEYNCLSPSNTSKVRGRESREIEIITEITQENFPELNLGPQIANCLLSTQPNEWHDPHIKAHHEISEHRKKR